MNLTGTSAAPVLDETAEQSWLHLRSRVDGVRSRQRMKYFGTGVLAAVAVFVAAFLGFSAADILFKLSVGTRMFALLSTAIAIAFALFQWVYRPWKKLGNTVQSAREVEGAFPQLEQQLSTALEFGSDKEKAQKFASPVLVAALVKQAGERSNPLDFSRTIRWRQLAFAFFIAFVLAILMGVYAAKGSRLFAITWSRFMKPMADIPAPTLTEIKSVEPGDAKFAMESSVPVVVALEGRLPDTATLSVLIGDEKESHWEDRPMDRGEDGLYRATLRRLLDSARYKIRAGDADSREFKIKVFKTPEISEFTVSIEHPAYTGKGLEPLPIGTGDVRALRGSKIHVDIKSNVELGSASIGFKSRRAEAVGKFDAAEPRKAQLVFDVDKDDDYQIKIADTDGNPGSGALFQIKALRDRYPRVIIKKPEKDLMVQREQTVEVEISADDDIGVSEIGIFHSIDLDEKQIRVRRLDPQPLRVDGKLVWDLAKMNLKGGEVIAYYAYAIDNDTVSPGGPKMSKSDIQFLTVYDEEKYDGEKDPKKKQPGTPPEVKAMDKLLDVQKKLLRETFVQARTKEALRDKDDAERAKAVEGEKTAAMKTREAQAQLRARVETMIEDVKKEMAKADDPDAKPADPKEEPKPKAFGEKELKHLEAAVEKMKVAEGHLEKPDAPGAVTPETEALRHLSETRRLLLSDKEGDPRFKMAMNKNSKKKQKQDQDQQQQDQQQAKQELTEMPKMMEKQKELDRQIEELNERKKKQEQQDQKTEEAKREQAEQRELQRKAEEEAKKLAKEAEERARSLERLADRNNDMKPAADKMKEAAEKLDQAAKDLKEGEQKKNESAQEKNQRAQQDNREAQRSLRSALEKQVRQEMNNLQKDAQELAQRQQDLAQEMQQMANQQPQPKPDGKKPDGQKPDGQKPDGQKPDGQKPDGQKPDGQKPDGQKPDGQKPDGQKPDGQKPDGQKPDGQKPDGQKPDGQKPDGQKPDGKQPNGQQPNGQQPDGQQPDGQQPDGQQPDGQQQSASAQKRMQGMANSQRDIKSDLKDLNERAKNLADKAHQENLAGADDVDQAEKQASEHAAANQAAEKAMQAMSTAKKDEAAREANNAAKAMQQLADTMKSAQQKTDAGDMQKLASAIKKLQAAVKEQGDITKDLANKAEPDPLAAREQKVADAAKDIADATQHMETLRHAGAQDNAKARLEGAAKQADEAAQNMKERNDAAAKAAADKAEQALNQALTEMERAAGKTLEEKARDAKNLAKSARENQEKANEAIKDVPNKAPGEKLDQPEAAKRDDAAVHEDQASRDAKRLEQALEGLKKLAEEANPAAADAAKDAHEQMQKAELPKTMDNLANDMKRFGTDKPPQDPASAKTPVEANKKGEEIAQTLKQMDKHLDEYIAEARNSLEERLKAMEESARKASEMAAALAGKDEKKPDPNAPKKDEAKPDSAKKPVPNAKPDEKKEANEKDPNAKPNPDNPADPKKLGEPNKDPNQAKANDPTKPDPNAKDDPKNNPEATNDDNAKPSEQEAAKQREELKQQLKKLQPKLERFEANSPERAKMKEAMAALEQADKENENASEKPGGKPEAGKKNMGGPAFRKVSKQMDEIAQGIMERRERLLRARDIRPDEDEDAPKEYRTLVDKYYRALSEDVEDGK